jgi:RNA polymerase-binding transcription factor DksA
MNQSAALLKDQEARLLARRQGLLEEIRLLQQRLAGDQDMALVGQAHDTKDQSTAQALREAGSIEMRHNTEEMQDIDAALQRIAGGTYGQCTDCGADIPPARLAAYPTAKRCLPCQEKHEQARGRTSRTP